MGTEHKSQARCSSDPRIKQETVQLNGSSLPPKLFLQKRHNFSIFKAMCEYDKMLKEIVRNARKDLERWQ